MRGFSRTQEYWQPERPVPLNHCSAEEVVLPWQVGVAITRTNQVSQSRKFAIAKNQQQAIGWKYSSERIVVDRN